VNKITRHPYELPLISGGVRRGVLVSYQGGWGDVAPLPGWSLESVNDVLAWESPQNVPPSLQSAMEAAQASSNNFADWPLSHPQIPINALLTGSAEDMIAKASSDFQNGCRCFKIKTTSMELAKIRDFTSRLAEITDGICQFRIDPNRSWTFDQTLRIAESLAGLPIEYIEEPLATSEQLPDLIAQCPFPVALDETLREIRPDGLSALSGAAALVLKPTLMGGFEICSKFVNAGKALGMKSVISACYESGVGIYALGRFAASLESLSAVGLDTYSSLEHDLLEERLDFSGFIFNAMAPLPHVKAQFI
jgi:O-succinylbenzoate synthase